MAKVTLVIDLGEEKVRFEVAYKNDDLLCSRNRVVVGCCLQAGRAVLALCQGRRGGH